MSNLPPGCTEAMIDRAFGCDPDYDEPTDADLDEAYLDALEAEAETLPRPVFHECERPQPAPVMTERKWTEFRMFLDVLAERDLDRVIEMAELQLAGRARRRAMAPAYLPQEAA